MKEGSCGCWVWSRCISIGYFIIAPPKVRCLLLFGKGTSSSAKVFIEPAKSSWNVIPSWSKKFHDSEIISPVLVRIDITCQFVNKLIFGISHLENRRHSNENINFVFNISTLFWQSWEHLDGSLGVSDIGNLLLACVLCDIVYHRRNIRAPQLMEREIIVLIVLISIQIVMTSWVDISSIVSHPDIVSSIR